MSAIAAQSRSVTPDIIPSRLLASCRPLTARNALGVCNGLRRNPLGSSGLTVTDVCMGTMTFGEQNTEAEAHEMLSYAADCGVNFLDTAEVYPVVPRAETSGATSRIIGTWLRQRKREEFVIASKVAGRSPGLEWIRGCRLGKTDAPVPPSTPKLDGPSIIAAAEAELRRLGTDYLDLFQLHWPDRYVPSFGHFQYQPQLQDSDIVPFTEQVDAIGKLIKQGKIRSWGLSNESAFGVMSHCAAAAALGVPRPVTIQNHYSLIQRTYEGDLAETCLHLGVGLLPWSPLAGGALSGKYLGGGPAPQGSRFDLFGARYARFNSPRVHAAVERYKEIACQAGLRPEQLALAFCRSRWFTVSTIIGATSMEQLRNNLVPFMAAEQGGGIGIDLSDSILTAIGDVHNAMRNPALID